MSKFRNVAVTKVNIGLFSICILVVLIGAIAQYQTERIWQGADGIYNHPLTVQRSLTYLSADIVMIDKYVIDDQAGLLSALTVENQKLQEQQKINAVKDAKDQIAVLRTSYLGPQTDIDKLEKDLEVMDTEKDVTIDTVYADAQVLSKFAEAKATSFYNIASVYHDAARTQLSIAMGLAVLIAWLILYWLTLAIDKKDKETADLINIYTQKLIDKSAERKTENGLD